MAVKVIGLTGGIGTGKSTASAYLKQKGFAVIDADQIARQVVEPGMPLLMTLAKTFGSQILREDGSLDRKALASIVFSDPDKRRTLDGIMHGAIIQVIDEQIAACRKERCRGILIDAPLLFETNLDEKCSSTWLITARQDIRIARVCARDNMTREEVEARIRSQMDEGEKRRRANIVIDNSGTREELEMRLDEVLKQEGCELP